MALYEKNHICSRESCPPSNVSGNKLKCFMCLKQFYSKCFGLDVTIYDAFGPHSPFEAGSVFQFVCPLCLTKPKLSTTSPRTPMVDKLDEIITTMKVVVNSQKKTELQITKMVENAGNVDLKLEEVHSIGTDTKETCYRVEKNLQSHVHASGPSYSDIIKANLGSPSGLIRSAKRPRTEFGPNVVTNGGNVVQNLRPKPRIGTSDAIIGQAMPEIRGGSNEATRRKFDRSLWISRFHNETTTDQIMDFVVTVTGCDDRTKFFCKKLVKRDVDVASLGFVSFKIDVLEEFFDRLSDPSVWPKYVLVREFLNERRSEPIKVAVLGGPDRLMNTNGGDATPLLNGSINLMDQE